MTTGEVPSEETRRLAAAITQDTPGVTLVQNNLVINPGAERNKDTLADRVADLEIKTIVIDQLAQSPELREKRLTVRVNKRIVTLDGAVDSPAQKRVAEQIVLQVPGVQGLAGQISVAKVTGSPETVEDKLAAEKLLAERVTQSVDGVKWVVNNLNAREETAAR